MELHVSHSNSRPPAAVSHDGASSGSAGRIERKYDLEERLLEFAAAVIDVSEKLPNTRAGNHLAGQLLRAGTSPYGNHGEAQAPESADDFIHKMKICLKELRESLRWARLIHRKRWLGRDDQLSTGAPRKRGTGSYLQSQHPNRRAEPRQQTERQCRRLTSKSSMSRPQAQDAPCGVRRSAFKVRGSGFKVQGSASNVFLP